MGSKNQTKNQFLLLKQFLVLIIQMIINTNLSSRQKQTIEYIRNIVGLNRMVEQSQESQDSLILSKSQSEEQSVRVIVPQKGKKRQKKGSSKYVSPYKQNAISMKKILNFKKASREDLGHFDNLTVRQQIKKQSVPKSPKILNITNRYMQSPCLIERLAKNQLDKMKQQAHLIYLNQRKQKEGMTESQRKMKWADFLLRERRWEESRQNKLMEAKHKAISLQKQFFTHFVAREPPKMDVEDHIRKVKRQKLKLQEKLRQLEPNFFLWKNHKSPNKYRTPKTNQEQKEKQAKSDKKICLSSQKQISFLLKR